MGFQIIGLPRMLTSAALIWERPTFDGSFHRFSHNLRASKHAFVHKCSMFSHTSGTRCDWTISDSKGNPVLLWPFDMGNRQNMSIWFDSRQNVVLEIMYEVGVPHGAATQTSRRSSRAQKVRLRSWAYRANQDPLGRTGQEETCRHASPSSVLKQREVRFSPQRIGA
jgi:hypothetical protein